MYVRHKIGYFNGLHDVELFKIGYVYSLLPVCTRAWNCELFLRITLHSS
jgi:hypothetical protein